MSIYEDLSKIVGKAGIEVDPMVLKLYTKNAAYMEGRAKAVVFPRNTREVSEIVKYCYKNDIKIYPQGTASELPGASIPTEDGIVLSFDRMNKILSINVVDSYVEVEPGVRIGDLNAKLAAFGYMFPMDPASVSAATIGGFIGTGGGGMMGVKYGTAKDWVNQLELVLPDENGSIVTVGCKTTKCRQGYDLVRLIVGAEGTLAIVTKAVLKITPIPENVVTVAAFFDDLNDLLKSTIDIKKRRFDVFVMEFLDSETVKTAIEGYGAKIRGEGNYLVTSVVSPLETAEKTLNALEEILKNNNAKAIYKARTLSEAESNGLFDIRRAAYPASIKIAQTTKKNPLSKVNVFVEDISVPPSKIVEAVEKIRLVQRKYGLPMTLLGHVGDGNLHPIIWYETSEKDAEEKFEKMFTDIMRIAIELGGTVSSEHGIGTAKIKGLQMEFEALGSLLPLELMKSIKRVFDPKNILNPGKMFL